MHDRLKQKLNKVFEQIRNEFLDTETVDFPVKNFGEAVKISRMSADASIKQYFRVSIDGQNYILLVLPVTSGSAEEEFTRVQDLEISQSQSFIEAGCWLSEHVAHVPEIFFHDMEQGLVLLSDNGGINLYDIFHKLSKSDLEEYYLNLVDWLGNLEKFSVNDVPQSLTRKFTREALLTEMLDFIDYGMACGSTGKTSQTFKDQLLEELTELAAQIDQLPERLMHRDFQSKNILCDLPDNTHTIIDYQDMCMGPKYYDLASLMYDPYILFGPDQIKRIGDYYFQNYAAGIVHDEFMQGLNRVAIQRLLKAAGRYARLKILHGKETHMQFFYPAIQKLDSLLQSAPAFPKLRQVISAMICL